MTFCKYHPLQPATYACPVCETTNCDACTNEPQRSGERSCFLCEGELEFLGSGHSATPFWRRLEQSFRYPLSAQAIILIVGVSVMMPILGYLPFTFIWYLMVFGAFLKYCFSCLDNTAHGLMVPPDITEAYGGGLGLVGKLLAILLSTTAIIVAAYNYLGGAMAGIVATVLIAGLPASMINFAIRDSLLAAISPLSTVRLMTTIGLSYGLLLALIMIMMGSVGVINELIGTDFSLMTSILQSLVSNYYMIVVFHLMGYMIFQYQDKLGFAATESTGEAEEVRSERDRLAAQIDVTLKEGDYDRALQLFIEALKQFPVDLDFYDKAFKFLCVTGNKEHIDDLGSMYLDFLIKKGRGDQIRNVFQMALQVNPAFMPRSAATRHALASACHETGDFMAAAKLINGLHKQAPEYPKLVQAYELMLECLKQLPELKAKVEPCQKLIEALRNKAPAPAATAPTEPAPQKASFPVEEPAPAAAPTETAVEPEPVQGEEEQSEELAPIEFK